MLDRAARGADSRADMERPSPAWFVSRAADRHTADPNNLEFALLEDPNLVWLLEPLQNYIKASGSAARRHQHHLLDIAQPVLAEKDLVTDKEGGRPESTAGDRRLR